MDHLLVLSILNEAEFLLSDLLVILVEASDGHGTGLRDAGSTLNSAKNAAKEKGVEVEMVYGGIGIDDCQCWCSFVNGGGVQCAVAD